MYAIQDWTGLSLLVGQILTFLLAAAGFGVALWREARNRRWDLEDRALARQELNLKLAAYHVETTDKIDANTKVSENAFHEANDAKKLIASIEEARNKIQSATIDIATDVKEGTTVVADAAERIQANTERSAAALEKLTSAPVPVVSSDRRSKK